MERIRRALEAPPLPASTLLLLHGDDELPDEWAGLAMPEWAAGIAVSPDRIVVIRTDRIGRYGQRELAGVFAHETAHLMMFEAAGATGPGPARMPGWFREGVAANLAREGEWQDFMHLWLSPASSGRRPLSSLSLWLQTAGSSGRRRAAYAGSFAFVRFAIERHSERLPALVLQGLREGLDFEAAWARATGVPLAQEEAAWAETIRGRSRWISIVTSSFVLWAAMTLLFLMAWWLKRRRARRVIEQWEAMEPLDESPRAPAGEPGEDETVH
ncbi:MAG TPA: hypothetical protein VFP98_01070 [Candidatus Polarisedimenticolia bacterium]|nr:hypothetical protein [Candidatus Polarisedimenticolia bacterium]